jgi:hypothetical protein
MNLHLRPVHNIILIINDKFEADVTVYQITKLNSWSWGLLEKLPIVQLLKNFPAFYGTWRFITVFTRAPPLVPILSQIDVNNILEDSADKVCHVASFHMITMEHELFNVYSSIIKCVYELVSLIRYSV